MIERAVLKSLELYLKIYYIPIEINSTE